MCIINSSGYWLIYRMMLIVMNISNRHLFLRFESKFTSDISFRIQFSWVWSLNMRVTFTMKNESWQFFNWIELNRPIKKNINLSHVKSNFKFFFSRHLVKWNGVENQCYLKLNATINWVCNHVNSILGCELLNQIVSTP